MERIGHQRGAARRGPLVFGHAPLTKTLRDQLIEARDRVRRELKILLSPSSIGGGADNHSVVADLEAELRQLEDALAESN